MGNRTFDAFELMRVREVHGDAAYRARRAEIDPRFDAATHKHDVVVEHRDDLFTRFVLDEFMLLDLRILREEQGESVYEDRCRKIQEEIDVQRARSQVSDLTHVLGMVSCMLLVCAMLTALVGRGSVDHTPEIVFGALFFFVGLPAAFFCRRMTVWFTTERAKIRARHASALTAECKHNSSTYT